MERENQQKESIFAAISCRRGSRPSQRARSRFNSSTFSEKQSRPSQRWTRQDTEEFYSLLEAYGADFSLFGDLLARIGAHRLRKKFKKERKVNPQRVDEALLRHQHERKSKNAASNSLNDTDEELAL